MPEENQKQYELIFILSPEFEQKEIDSFEQEVEKDIKNLGGNLKKQGKIEKRDLAYPIKKFQSAYYLIVNFLFNPEKIEELSVIFKHKKGILRFIITFIEEPSPAKEKKKKKPKSKVERLKELAKEITEEEVQEIKKETKKKKKPSFAKATEGKEVKLEEIDKKLDEILGI